MTDRLWFLVLLASLGSPLAARADQDAPPGDPPPPRHPLVARLDKDGDGRVSLAEWQGPDGSFAPRDKNGDGYLTPDELPLPPEGGPGGDGPRRRLAEMDKDQDGVITREEWTGPEEMFARLDKNSDGRIEKDELPARGEGGRGNWRQRLAEMDKDKDGVITREEWTGREEMFGRLDKNGDGRITEDEMPKPREGGPRERPRDGEPKPPKPPGGPGLY